MRLLGIITLKTLNYHVEDLTISCFITADSGDTPLPVFSSGPVGFQEDLYILFFKILFIYFYMCFYCSESHLMYSILF